jgi:hypothetical protein
MKAINAVCLAAGIAAVLAVVIAPALTPNEAYADRKTKCDQDPGNPNLGSSCPGQSGVHNPNRNECHSNSPNSANFKCVGN